jgi:hypothetical protein
MPFPDFPKQFLYPFANVATKDLLYLGAHTR